MAVDLTYHGVRMQGETIKTAIENARANNLLKLEDLNRQSWEIALELNEVGKRLFELQKSQVAINESIQKELMATRTIEHVVKYELVR